MSHQQTNDQVNAASMRYTHVLLDIEGTTCPVDYVTGILFPYASEALPSFLEKHQGNEEINSTLEDIKKAWAQEDSPEAAAMAQDREQPTIESLIEYIRWLIRSDRKLTPLKNLQGKIWNDGYLSGELIAPLFEDTSAAIKSWKSRGASISSYSSGSIEAQQLLYQYSIQGDLRAQFSYWFDTSIGPKKETESYKLICRNLNAEPANVLFISDINAELQAAATAGLAVRFSDRAGNPEQPDGRFQSIRSLTSIHLN